MRNKMKEKYSFLDAFVDVHTGLYTSPEIPEPDLYLVIKLQDRMNMRKYFDAAVSNVTKEKHSL